MNLYKKISILSLITATTLFVGCDNKDDSTGASSLKAVENVTGVVSIPVYATVQNEASGNAIPFSVTIDKPQIADIRVAISQIAGTAKFDEDYTAPTELVIPAYSTTASGVITILDDCTPEAAEGLTIQIGDVTTANVGIPTKTMVFTINNNFSPVNTTLDLEFAFNKTVTFNGSQVALCAASYDMDFYITDAAFNDTGYYDAAASGCPEGISLSTDPAAPNYLADGTYYVFYDVFDTGNLNGGANTTTDGFERYYHEPFDIPVTVSYSRCGSLDLGVFNQESQYYASSTNAANVIDTSFGPTSTYVVTIEVNAGVFTLKNSIPTVIASGRTAGKKFDLAKARRNNPNKK